MYYSYQQEYPKNEIELHKKVLEFLSSAERNNLIEKRTYLIGENAFIIKLQKKIWDDSEKTEMVNPFAPNYKTCYGFFKDMVNQKNNALFAESPAVKGLNENEQKKLGYVLKSSGIKKSTQGYSIIYENNNGDYYSFWADECMLYIDDITQELRTMIRIFNKIINNKEILFCEVYDEIGISKYKENGNKFELEIARIPYQYKTLKSSLLNNVIETKLSKIPIVIDINNENMESDLTYNIKSKIDMIDLLESGLVNNIEEFSDVWLTLNAPMDERQAQAVKSAWRRTKTLITTADENTKAGIQTIEIPYQARQTAAEMLKRELVEDAGVVDFATISGQSTATEIMARTFKLKERVSDYEWFADETATELVLIRQEYTGNVFDISVTFSKLFIQNEIDLVNIANSIYGKVSNETYLKLLQEARIVDNVDKELKRLEQQDTGRFSFTDDEEEVVNEINEFGTQEN